MNSITVDVTYSHVIINGERIPYNNTELFTTDGEAYLAWWLQSRAEDIVKAMTKYERPNQPIETGSVSS